ncbi:hypothetical protein [Companilactobacillus musae]|uniref:hypothetical protein n=1 Tax=Companilactobacillus musae TaxID=1903258 RepID=UPI000E659269|nr:hypothetical protein [Companilactobacillus musae]
MTEHVNYDVLHPSYKALWDLLGEDNMLKVYDQFRGTQLQLPMKLYDRVKLEKFLNDGPDKRDVRELSNIYGFSPRWIKKHIES